MHYWVYSMATQIFQTFWHNYLMLSYMMTQTDKIYKKITKNHSLCVYSKEEKYADVGRIKETRKEPNILVYLFIKVIELNLLASTSLQPTANQVKNPAIGYFYVSPVYFMPVLFETEQIQFYFAYCV